MPSTRNIRRAISSSIASAPFVATSAAWAAPRLEDEWSTAVFWLLFAVVQFLWAVGYLGSSAPKLLSWVDGGLRGKLEVISGLACAFIGGNAAYFLGYYSADLARIACLFAAIGGGFLGERYLTPLFMRLLPGSQPAARGADGSS